jgi:hypothetical protein
MQVLQRSWIWELDLLFSEFEVLFHFEGLVREGFVGSRGRQLDLMFLR